MSQNEMKYTQRAWDRVVGIGKVPDEYAHKQETKLEEYKRKINYDVWDDVVQFSDGTYKKLHELKST